MAREGVALLQTPEVPRAEFANMRPLWVRGTGKIPGEGWSRAEGVDGGWKSGDLIPLLAVGV